MNKKTDITRDLNLLLNNKNFISEKPYSNFIIFYKGL